MPLLRQHSPAACDTPPRHWHNRDTSAGWMKFTEFNAKRESRRSFCKGPRRLLNSLRSILNRIRELNCFRARSSSVSGGRPGIEADQPYQMGESLGTQQGRRNGNRDGAARNNPMMFTPAAALQEGPTREELAFRDHVVRLKSVRNDLALNLPHTISLPDGEEGPGCQYKHIRLLDPVQQAEITCSFIRPPPNRTISNCTPVPFFSAKSVGHFPKPPTLTLTVPRNNPTEEPCVSPPPCAPSAASMDSVDANAVTENTVAADVAVKPPTSGANGNSLRTCDTQEVTDNQYDESDDPPPPYSDVVSQSDVNAVNRQHYSGV